MSEIVAFILVLLLAGGALFLLTSYLMARTLIRPPRMTDAKANWVLGRLTPQDIGLEYEPTAFTVRDAHSGAHLSLAAWWIPRHGSDRCVVLIHGYADAKVGAIAWAPLFHDLGYNVVALDLRAHGESDGAFTTAGYYERHDLNELFNRLRIDRPEETKHVVLFGASMGAAVACAAAVERDDLAGIILDSPFADFRTAAMAHCDLLGLPGQRLQRFALRWAERMTDASFDDISPVRLIPRLRCPVLLIDSGDDPFVTESDRVALEQAVRANALATGGSGLRRWHVPDVPHLMTIVHRPDEYRGNVASFLTAAHDAATGKGTCPCHPET